MTKPGKLVSVKWPLADVPEGAVLHISCWEEGRGAISSGVLPYLLCRAQARWERPSITLACCLRVGGWLAMYHITSTPHISRFNPPEIIPRQHVRWQIGEILSVSQFCCNVGVVVAKSTFHVASLIVFFASFWNRSSNHQTKSWKSK